MAKWEDSKADKKLDKAGAKKAGVSQAKFEGSPADKRVDAKAMRELDKRLDKGRGR